MEDDLIIGKELPEGEEPVAEEAEIDFYFPNDYELIVAAYYAMDAVEALDPMTERAKKRKRKIMRKSIEILEYAIDNLHALCFDEKPNDNEDNQES